MKSVVVYKYPADAIMVGGMSNKPAVACRKYQSDIVKDSAGQPKLFDTRQAVTAAERKARLTETLFKVFALYTENRSAHIASTIIADQEEEFRKIFRDKKLQNHAQSKVISVAKTEANVMSPSNKKVGVKT